MKRHLIDFINCCRNEFRILLHDSGLVLFVTFLPLAYPIIYSLIYNPEVVRDVKVVVVDHDRTAASRDLVRKMDAAQGCRIVGYASDLPEARRAMDSRECYGIMEIPGGYAKKLGRSEVSNVTLYCEMSLLLRYKSLLETATEVMQLAGAELQTQAIDEIPMAASYGSADLMPINYVAMGNIESGFASFILPAVLILILHQCIVLAIGMRGGAKRESPYFTGYYSSDGSRSVVVSMLATMTTYFIVLLPSLLYLVHYISLMFSFPMAGNIWEIVAFLLPLTLGAMCVGLCLQAIVWERESVFVLWVVTSVFLLFLSGITWPRYAMHGFWRLLSDICPSTWGVEGYVKMCANGSSLAQVGHSYAMLWILAGVWFAVAYCLQRWVVRPSQVRSGLPPGSVDSGM